MSSRISQICRLPFPLAPFVLAAFLASSCGPGDRKPVFPVTGSVYFQGRPAAGTRVAFHPSRDPSDHGLCPQAVVAADGSFRLTTYAAADGVPAGEYFVTLYAPASGPDDDIHVHPDRLGGRYADPKSTPLTAAIPAQAITLGRFDLK